MERLRAEGQTVIGVDLRDADITADLSIAGAPSVISVTFGRAQAS